MEKSIPVISLVQIAAEFKEIVDASPDFVYKKPVGSPVCLYVHKHADGTLTPGCIVGVWLHKYRGLPLEDIVDLDEEPYGLDVYSMNTRLSGYFLMTAEADDFAGNIQYLQDDGMTWRAAYEKAVRMSNASHGLSV